MRHGKSFNHLGRTASHRKALLSNLAISLIKHKRITTTVAKARELRRYVEPIITRSKDDSTHNRRIVFSYLQDKDSIKELFGTISEKVAARPGGYTRIIKLGQRPGDGSEMALIELVDFNELLLTESPAKKTRRSRRGSGTGKAAGVQASAPETAVAEIPAEMAPSADTEASVAENYDVQPAEGQPLSDEEVANAGAEAAPGDETASDEESKTEEA